VPYQPFRAADGYLIVACLTDKMWVSLCHALDRPDLAQDQHFSTNADRVLHRDDLIEILESIIASKTRAEWESKLDAVGVPASRIQTLADVHADPQVLANEYIVTQQHPVVGEIRTAGLPVKLSLTPGSIRRPAPMRGEHTFEVLAELGMSPEQIAELVSLGGARLADEK
jgi:crotonobetainyl-CoA:carnitine CoA-transferase CaiB-like acyl-CoA transferase